MIKNKDRYSYYGVGSPSPMPFENNIEKQNLTEGYILRAYALLGCGKTEEAKEAAALAAEQNPYDFRLFALERIMV